MVEENEEAEDGETVDVTEFLELSSAPIPGFNDAEAQTQAVRIETFNATEQEVDIKINEPEIEGSDEEKWDPAELNEYTTESKFYDAHAVWYKENPETTDDVAFEIARENEDGELEVNYEALNSAYDLAETTDRLQPDNVNKLRALLTDLREEWFPDREPLDADESEEEDVAKEPFAGYKDFDECVKDNQDKDDPEAFCGWLEDQVNQYLNSEEDSDSRGDNMTDEKDTEAEEEQPENTEQEQDIEDLADALDWIEANAPEEVINMIQDAIQSDEEEPEEDEEETETEEDKEEKLEKLEERLKKLEEKEEVEPVKDPGAVKEQKHDLNKLVDSMKEKVKGGE